MILIATPLVLMRSKQLVALGVEWFRAYQTAPKTSLRSVKGIGIVAVSFGVAALASWFLANHWLVGSTGWVLFAKAMVVGWLTFNLGLAVVVARGDSGLEGGEAGGCGGAAGGGRRGFASIPAPYLPRRSARGRRPAPACITRTAAT